MRLKEFFQSKIIDNEGSDDLLNRDNFNLFIKGLMISAYDFSDDLMLILDYANAKIKINYEYDEYDTNDTTDVTSDDTIEKKKSVFEINLQGNQINIINSIYLSINNNLDNNNINKIILKEIDKKILSYKNQDIVKNKYNNNNISSEQVIEKLVASKLKCFYCKNKTIIKILKK